MKYFSLLWLHSVLDIPDVHKLTFALVFDVLNRNKAVSPDVNFMENSRENKLQSNHVENIQNQTFKVKCRRGSGVNGKSIQMVNTLIFNPHSHEVNEG